MEAEERRLRQAREQEPMRRLPDLGVEIPRKPVGQAQRLPEVALAGAALQVA